MKKKTFLTLAILAALPFAVQFSGWAHTPNPENDGIAIDTNLDNASQTVSTENQSVVYGLVHSYSYPGIVRVGQPERFWIDDNWGANYSVDIYVSSAKDEGEPLDDPSRYTIVSSNNRSAEIVFNTGGIYYVHFNFYSLETGILEASYTSYQVLVQ